MLCVWSASEQHHPDTETPSPTRVGNPRTVFAALAPWSCAIGAPLWSPQPSITPLRPAPRSGGPPQRLPRDHFNTCSANRLGRFNRDVAADDRNGISGEGQGGRTSHASVRVSDDAELAYKPARHLSGPRRPQRRASPPRQRPPSRCAWDLVEVLVDDVARRPGERRCPVAEELRHDGERRGRDCSGVRQQLDGYAVRGPRPSADGVGHVQETRVQALLRRVSGSPCRSKWRGWIVHRSDHSRRTRPRYSRHWTRCDSRDSDALVTSASELIRMVRCGFVESMPRTWYSTIRRFESRCSC